MDARVVRLISAVLAFAGTVLVSGCGTDEGGTPGTGDGARGPTTPIWASSDHRAGAAGGPPGECPFHEAGYDAAAWHQHLPSEHQPVYEKVLVCSNGTHLVLTNKSDQVWVFPPAEDVRLTDAYPPAPESEFFRSANAWPDQDFMVPGDVVVLPEAAVENTITWHPDVGLTVAWNHQQLATDFVLTYGAEYVDRTLKKRTPHSTAVAGCTLEGYRAAEAWREIDASSDSIDHVQALLKSAGAAACNEPMRQADAAAMSAAGGVGAVPERVPPTRPSWQQQVGKFTGSADEALDHGRYIGAVLDACAVLPKC